MPVVSGLDWHRVFLQSSHNVISKTETDFQLKLCKSAAVNISGSNSFPLHLKQYNPCCAAVFGNTVLMYTVLGDSVRTLPR